jgi:hypothetical protein
VSAIIGADNQASASAVIASIKTNRPILQIGQRRGCCSPVFVPLSLGELVVGSVAVQQGAALGQLFRPFAKAEVPDTNKAGGHQGQNY